MHKLWEIRLAVILICAGFLSASAATASVTLESSFNVTQTYTDNLFYEDKDRESDLGTLFGPNLSLQYDNPDIVIGVMYFGRVALFVNNPNENRYIQNANLNLELPFLTKQYKGLTVSIQEDMNLTPQLDAFSLSGARDASSSNTLGGGVGGRDGGTGGGGGTVGTGGTGSSQGLGGQGVFTSRASAFSNVAGITFGYVWMPRVTSSLGYANQYLHFFSSGFQDSVTHTGNFSLSYEVTDRTTVTPIYVYRQTHFLGQTTQNTAGDKIISHQPQLGISYVFTPLVRGSIRGGVAFTKQKGAEEIEGGNTTSLSNKWQTGFIGGATISKLYRNGEISLDANQTVGNGGGLAAQSTLSRTITGSIQHALLPRLNAFGSVGYGQNKSTGGGNAFNTNTYRIQGGIEYVFLRWLSGTLSYSHIEQISDGPAAQDLRVNQVFLGLTAFADPWVLMR